MEKIVVATDFSVRSDRALRRASLIARKVGAQLTLVHVIDADFPAQLSAAEKAAASAMLDDLAGTLTSNDGIAADWLLMVDDVHAGILAAADRIDADLIVIGPNRRRLLDIFVGTTAERVLKKSTRPLLIAVEQAAAHYRSALLALDFDDASKAAAREALAIGVFEHTEVVVMHAFDAPAEHLLKRSLERGDVVAEYVDEERGEAGERLRALREELGLPMTGQCVVAAKGAPARTILQSALEVGSDLIVLGTNQRKGFERALIGSVAADVIRDAHRDIMIIPVDAPE